MFSVVVLADEMLKLPLSLEREGLMTLRRGPAAEIRAVVSAHKTQRHDFIPAGEAGRSTHGASS